MVKLCIGLGQEHPEGVLQPSDTEVVLTFQCDTDIMAVMCSLTAAMVWWGEPIMLHIPLPKVRQVREYIAMRGSHPSGTQAHVEGKGEGIWPLPRLPSLDKVPLEDQASTPQVELARDVQDLNDEQLQQTLEALQAGTAQKEGAVTLLGSPQGNVRGPMGSGGAINR